MKIHILSKELINQIAAGEVVERPASVMKELIENAIDAQAKNISVVIENGGKSLVKVSDDGAGMNREDAKLSILPHATSKIATAADLFNINTFGFRGEALSSIAAVSRFELVTRPRDSIAGTAVTVRDGQMDFADCPAAPGTTVTVKDLFYNIPARQKYLRTNVTEFNHIIDLFLNYCLAYAEINWKLSHNGKLVYQFPPAERRQRIADVLGNAVSKNLVPVAAKLALIELNGFIGLPAIARHNRQLQYLTINRRPVTEFIIAKQIKDTYVTLLPKELYPVYLLDVAVRRDKVDVNVHPRKLEVRFSDPAAIYREIYQIVAQTLDEHNLSRQVTAPVSKNFIPIKEIIPSAPMIEHIQIKSSAAAAVFKARGRSSSLISAEPLATTAMPDILSASPTSEFKILGQAQNSYIIVETVGGIKIYDQHAASERVQYEHLQREWLIGKLASQRLLLPQNIELTPTEARLLNDNLDLFDKLGFGIVDFGANTFSISRVPPLLAKEDLKELVLSILGELTEAVVLSEEVQGPLENILKMVACRCAIKFGDALSGEGMRALLNDLDKLDNQYTCVHGRPLVLEFKFSELEKMFKRK